VGVTDRSFIRLSFIEPSYLLAVGIVLLGTFVSLGSNQGLEAPLLAIVLVWALHLSVGLVAIRAGVIGLSRWPKTAKWSDLSLLAVAGFIASLVLAPVSFVIDQSLSTLGVDTDDELLIGSGASALKILFGIVEEWTHVIGPTVLVAVMLALPAWWADRQAITKSSSITSNSLEFADSHPEAKVPIDSDAMSSELTETRSCLQRLPPALGAELIAAQSELQYVRIYTTRGDALVLGALKDVAEQRESEGQLVHRTWWVSNRHVRTLRRKGTQYVLTMANGLEIPVSRRRQQGLIRQFGLSTTLN
jgi:hypothetical protein